MLGTQTVCNCEEIRQAMDRGFLRIRVDEETDLDRSVRGRFGGLATGYVVFAHLQPSRNGS